MDFSLALLSEYSYFLYHKNKSLKTGHLGYVSVIFPVHDPRGEALPNAHETWNCAESVYGNHRRPLRVDWTTESKGSEQKQVHSNQLTFIEEKIKIKILEPGVSVFKRNQCNKRSVDSCVLTLTICITL